MPIHLKLFAMIVFWGLTPTIARLLASYEAPFVMVFGRFLVASLFLTAFACAGGHLSTPIKWKHLPGLAFLGLTGIFLHNLLLFKGVEHTQANTASVIMGLIVMAVAVLDFILFGKRLSTKAVIGVIAGFLGVSIVVSHGDPSELFVVGIGVGHVLLVGSALSWAVYSVAGRPLLREFPPILVTCCASVFGTLFLAPFALGNLAVVTQVASDWRAVGLISFLGIFGSALGFLWYYQGVAKIGMVNTVIYVNLVPVFGVATAAFVLREIPDAGLVSGGLLVIAGVILVNKTNNEKIPV